MKALLKVFVITLLILFNITGCIQENSGEDSQYPIFDKGIVSFRIDDNLLSAYNRKDIFESRNLRATLIVNPGRLETTGKYKFSDTDKAYMTWDQLIELYDNGWEVGNHTFEHTILIGLSKAQAEKAITKALWAFEKKGLTDIVTFAFPRSLHDRVGVKAAKKYHKINTTVWARSEYPYGSNCGTEKIVPKHMTNTNKKFPNLLPAFFIDKFTIDWKKCGDPSSMAPYLNNIRNLIDSAYEEKRWLILGMHDIVDGCEQNNANYSIEDSALEDILDYIINKGMPILTMREAWNYYNKSQGGKESTD